MHDLTELLQAYLGHLQDLNGSRHTRERIRSVGTLFLGWLASVCGVTDVRDLRREHLHQYQHHLAEYTTSTGLPLKPSSLNSRVKSIRSFLEFLYRRRYIGQPLPDQLAYVKESRLLPSSVLNHAQVQALLQQIPTDCEDGVRDRAAIELLYSTGVRISELEGLSLADVDLGTATMKVLGKGGKERLVPIGKTALTWLTS